ncbi:MAG TPA: hypothetical protein VJR58_26945 [Vineibacter sp.]|nr:hypothetical protein [Vineibacter sp.]
MTTAPSKDAVVIRLVRREDRAGCMRLWGAYYGAGAICGGPPGAAARLERIFVSRSTLSSRA